MKTKINGFEVEGSIEEIRQLINLGAVEKLPVRKVEIRHEVVDRIKRNRKKGYGVVMSKYDEIKTLLSQGKSYKQISRITGINYSSIANFVGKYKELHDLYAFRWGNNLHRKNAVHNIDTGFNKIKGYRIKQLMNEGKTFGEAYKVFCDEWNKLKNGGVNVEQEESGGEGINE